MYKRTLLSDFNKVENAKTSDLALDRGRGDTGKSIQGVDEEAGIINEYRPFFAAFGQQFSRLGNLCARHNPERVGLRFKHLGGFAIQQELFDSVSEWCEVVLRFGQFAQVSGEEEKSLHDRCRGGA